MPSPFDFINSINDKKYLYEDVDKTSYSQYIVNKGLSFFPDTLMLVNEINKYDVDPKQHYDFLFYSVPKKKRFSKWFKAEKHEDIEMLREGYRLSYDKAREVARVLSEVELTTLRKQLEKGGKE